MSRSASVTVDFAAPSGARVRRFTVGTLAAGSHQVAWDGKDSGGSVTSSGVYAGKITAVNVVGTVSLPVNVHVDTVPPVVAWAAAMRTISLGKTLRVGFSVTDSFTRRAFAVIVVQKPNGTAATRPTLTVAPGAQHTWSFRPGMRGIYTIVLHATDRAGNGEAHAALLTLTVK
jgi:hypothetical protein